MTLWLRLILISVIWLVAPQLVLASTADADPPPEPLIIRRDETVSHIIVQHRPLRVLGKVEGNILVLGSDAIIEGRVGGDAMAVGGSIIHRQGGFIGGDVLIIGGQYRRAADALPLPPNSKVLLIPSSGDVLRETLDHPWRSLFVPQFTPLYIGLRLLGMLLFFLAALLLIALIPAQLTRAVQSLNHNYLRISLVGIPALGLFLLLMLLVIRSLPIEVAVSITAFALLFYVAVSLFGSLAVYLLLGRWIQHWVGRGRDHSNINALLYALALTAVLFSIPVVGILIRLGLLILSFGIVVTLGWKPTKVPARE